MCENTSLPNHVDNGIQNSALKNKSNNKKKNKPHNTQPKCKELLVVMKIFIKAVQ